MRRVAARAALQKRPRRVQLGAMTTRALYPGSFDPLTYGHVDIIQRGLLAFDEIVVAIAKNSGKSPLFTVDELVNMAKISVGNLPGVDIVTFDGLLVEFAKTHGIRVVLRGLRAVSDFEYEFQLATMNRRLADQIESVFMMTGEKFHHLSSSLVKEVALLGGDVSSMVPPVVNASLVRVRKERG